MNNTFNFNRFGLLLKRQWLDFGRIYLISLLVVVGAMIGFYYYNMPSPHSDHNFDYEGNIDMRFRYPIYLILGFLFISIVASSYFSILGEKSRAILEMMTPASNFEKFLCGVFYTTLVSFISYLIIFYFVDISFVKYINAHLSEYKSSNPKVESLKAVESMFTQLIDEKKYLEYSFAFFCFPFLITSIYLLGSAYFKKFHYIKTTVVVMVFSAISVFTIFKTADLLTRNMYRHNMQDIANKNNLILAFCLLTLLVTVIFWLITYVRLKEKEV